MLIELPHSVRVLSVRCGPGDSIIFDDDFLILGGEIKKILKRATLLVFIG